jgi:SIR2-like domain
MTSERIDSLLAQACRGNAILFLGAGFPASTIINILDEPVPGTAGLIASLLASVGETCTAEDRRKPLSDIADYCFSSEEWRASSVQQLRTSFSVKGMAEWQHKLITAPPWKRIYTTNYDNSIELAFGTAKRAAVAFSAMSKYVRPVAGTLTCVHINGMIGRADPGNVDSELRLSNASYANKKFEDSEWSNLLASDLAYSDSVIFVGFSMSDLDIGRLIVAEQVRERVIFFNGEHGDRFSLAKLKNYGFIGAQSGEELANRILNRLREHPPEPKMNIKHFTRIQTTQEPSFASDLDRYTLLLYGDLKQDLLLTQTTENSLGYVFKRAHEDQILVDLKSGIDIAILSGLGNGKSVFLACLAVRLNQSGWRVIQLVDNSPGALGEIEAICSFAGPQVVFIDEVSNNLKLLERIGLYRVSNTRIVIADRTLRYDRALDPIRLKAFHIDPTLICEYLFDELSDTEVPSLIRLFDSAGLWGEQARLEAHQKRHFLAKKCRGELSIALLGIAKSPELRQRLETALKSDTMNPEMQKALICVACLKVFGFTVPVHTVSRLIGTRAVESLLRTKSEVVSKLMDQSSGRLTVHSSIFASFFLREMLSPEVVLETLRQMVSNAHRHGIQFYLDESMDSTSKKPKNATELYLFRSLQLVIKSEYNFDSVYRFYETIREECSLQDEALYWLQYAISKLFSKDLEAAKRYLDTAYGAARRSNMSPFQIDNQYARYLLETTSSTGNTLHAYDAFAEAHRIILDQILQASHMHYPFRVALQYYDFVAMHRHALSAAQKEFALNAINAVIERTEVAKVPLDKQFWVDKCMKRLTIAAKFL